jgi:hypothetical protein
MSLLTCEYLQHCGTGMQFAKIPYRTHTHITCFRSTTGKPVPVRKPNPALLPSSSYALWLWVQVYEFMFGIPIFSCKHTMVVPDDYHLAQIIRFTIEEFPPDLIKTYKLVLQFQLVSLSYLLQ